MSDVIKLLPDSVANQIAAGEVIQRPASVVKELVENAVDAGAKCIKIILRDAGKTLIQVVDDGCGMSDTDARLAFERHATSKIRQAADLFELHTMGFRGEALPSIAAVAQIDLRTMRRGDRVGSHLQLAASKFESQTPEACAPGTNLAVKNLFFNFPARRKFLKRDAVELAQIVHEFERLALVNPHLEFCLVHNDVTLHQLLPATLKQRIADLFGKGMDRQLIPVATETPLVKISGFVGLPANARKRNALQYFFVNGRNMQHPYFRKAVLSCYDELIPADVQPNYFLDFEVDPQTIDVNIHPTKSEIKFENEQPIWQILQAAVRESLGKFNAVPSIEFDNEDAPDIPAFAPDATAPHELNLDPDYNPFASSAKGAAKDEANGQAIPSSIGAGHTIASSLGDRGSWEEAHRTATSDWDKLYAQFREASSENPDDYNPFAPEPQARPAAPISGTAGLMASHINAETPELEGIGTGSPLEGVRADAPTISVDNRYLITPAAGGALIIDRHRAHVRVLFERFLAMTAGAAGQSQQVLFPEEVTLSPSQHIILEGIKEETVTIGFALEYAGENRWFINAVPAAAGRLNAKDLLLKMIESVGCGIENGTARTAEAIHRHIALTMASSAAMRPNDNISETETAALLKDLLALPDPQYTPGGQPVFFLLPIQFMASRL